VQSKPIPVKRPTDFKSVPARLSGLFPALICSYNKKPSVCRGLLVVLKPVLTLACLLHQVLMRVVPSDKNGYFVALSASHK